MEIRYMMNKEQAIENLKLIRLNAGMTGAESFKEALDLAIVSLSQPSLPSDLDEAAEEYVKDYGYTEDDYKRERIIAEEHFKAGAEWQKEQMMKEAVEGYVTFNTEERK